MVDLDKRVERIWPKLTTDEKQNLLREQGRTTRYGFPVGSSLDPLEDGAEDVKFLVEHYEQKVKDRNRK